MCSAPTPHQQDSQDLRRAQYEHDEIQELIRERRDPRVPFVYGMAAAILGSAALLLWGVIGAVAISSPGAPQTRAFSSVVAFAAVLGVAASASVFTYVLERGGRRRAAESDRIREYDLARQAKVIQGAVAAALVSGEPDSGGLDPEVIELGRRINQKVQGAQSPGWNRAR